MIKNAVVEREAYTSNKFRDYTPIFRSMNSFIWWLHNYRNCKTLFRFKRHDWNRKVIRSHWIRLENKCVDKVDSPIIVCWDGLSHIDKLKMMLTLYVIGVFLPIAYSFGMVYLLGLWSVRTSCFPVYMLTFTISQSQFNTVNRQYVTNTIILQKQLETEAIGGEENKTQVPAASLVDLTKNLSLNSDSKVFDIVASV